MYITNDWLLVILMVFDTVGFSCPDQNDFHYIVKFQKKAHNVQQL